MPVDVSTIDGSVRAYLAQWAAILALMGSNAEARIRTERIPSSAGSGDRIRVQRLDTDDVRTLRGDVIRNHTSRVQVDVFSRTGKGRDNLASAVRLAMRRFPSWGWGDLQIIGIAKTVDQNVPEDPMDGSEEADYRALMQFDITHKNLSET